MLTVVSEKVELYHLSGMLFPLINTIPKQLVPMEKSTLLQQTKQSLQNKFSHHGTHGEEHIDSTSDANPAEETFTSPTGRPETTSVSFENLIFSTMKQKQDIIKAIGAEVITSKVTQQRIKESKKLKPNKQTCTKKTKEPILEETSEEDEYIYDNLTLQHIEEYILATEEPMPQDDVSRKKIGDWVVVKFCAGKKSQHAKHFIGQIIKLIPTTHTKIYSVFVWPDRDDIDDIDNDDIMAVLPQPTPGRRGETLFARKSKTYLLFPPSEKIKNIDDMRLALIGAGCPTRGTERTLNELPFLPGNLDAFISTLYESRCLYRLSPPTPILITSPIRDLVADIRRRKQAHRACFLLSHPAPYQHRLRLGVFTQGTLLVTKGSALEIISSEEAGQKRKRWIRTQGRQIGRVSAKTRRKVENLPPPILYPLRGKGGSTLRLQAVSSPESSCGIQVTTCVRAITAQARSVELNTNTLLSAPKCPCATLWDEFSVPASSSSVGHTTTRSRPTLKCTGDQNITTRTIWRLRHRLLSSITSHHTSSNCAAVKCGSSLTTGCRKQCRDWRLGKRGNGAADIPGELHRFNPQSAAYDFLRVSLSRRGSRTSRNMERSGNVAFGDLRSSPSDIGDDVMSTVSAESLIETRYRRQVSTPVQCFARRGDERDDAHVSVTLSAPTLVGLRRVRFLQPGGHLNLWNHKFILSKTCAKETTLNGDQPRQPWTPLALQVFPRGATRSNFRPPNRWPQDTTHQRVATPSSHRTDPFQSHVFNSRPSTPTVEEICCGVRIRPSRMSQDKCGVVPSCRNHNRRRIPRGTSSRSSGCVFSEIGRFSVPTRRNSSIHSWLNQIVPNNTCQHVDSECLLVGTDEDGVRVFRLPTGVGCVPLTNGYPTRMVVRLECLHPFVVDMDAAVVRPPNSHDRLRTGLDGERAMEQASSLTLAERHSHPIAAGNPQTSVDRRRLTPWHSAGRTTTLLVHAPPSPKSSVHIGSPTTPGRSY
ncbi:hypothetical protein PR048_007675 [Dryococelus australis]|uniref:Uncharacterized protein n=1 Tax=Dryococelus australis TaxID=614101 RepID=A0ABQ9HWK2_9NEOP|nr:hypothetical protein PR048_007675 [Dryococelus australis]